MDQISNQTEFTGDGVPEIVMTFPVNPENPTTINVLNGPNIQGAKCTDITRVLEVSQGGDVIDRQFKHEDDSDNRRTRIVTNDRQRI